MLFRLGGHWAPAVAPRAGAGIEILASPAAPLPPNVVPRTTAGLLNNGTQIVKAAKTFLNSDSGKKVMSSIAEYGYKYGLN